ncbi:uncharacterized protein FIBRA_06490 [Fibroporia radiculosa]|uniref:Gti1/Pac2 family protein n=1 Tax=Fibroporia radiculosa TaxID=599839 RepID=J4H438_9APHY|nr:uncharacterized protein FIBRA_06490 [Fibroporia radiculosa]CCM04319.1 predicted protein [Fibroporia radiculosa]
MITSGAIFVFSVEESGIKRWTEGLAWSQSRISGNFLIYREVTDRSSLRGSHQGSDPSEISPAGPIADGHVTLKPNGLIKKTITVKINGSDHHLISYFTQEDVRSGKLRRPTSRPDLMALGIPQELLQSANFRYPLKLEGQYGGYPSHFDDTDGIDNQRKGAVGPVPHPIKTGSRTALRLEDNFSGLSPIEMSPATYSAQDGRSSQMDLHYPSHHNHPAVAAQTPQAQYASGDHGAHSLDSTRSRDPIWSPSYAQVSYSISAETSATYPTPISISPPQSIHVGRDEAWTHHASRLRRGPDQGLSRIDIAAQSEMATWAHGDGASPILEQQYASAPAASTSINAQFPAGRGRDHIRTRSVPPLWTWGQESTASLYGPTPVSQTVYAPHGVYRSPN